MWSSLLMALARHECGTKICREKGIEYARRLLGHTNISTTQRYMHLDDRELADAQDWSSRGRETISSLRYATGKSEMAT
jgi:integrase